MFGYIQPLKCELKVREYDYYRSAYCGLCNALRVRYGIRARFIVNYDFVFIALLLSNADHIDDKKTKKRCIVCPFGKNCIESKAFDNAADISVILTYLKFCDEVKDNGFFGKLFKGVIPKMLFKKAYKRAVMNHSEYNEQACLLYSELCRLENSNVPSIDEPADKFARMLSLIANAAECNRRILCEIFYHIGRFVYVIDALDDLDEDFDKGEYNPIISRFNLTSKQMFASVKENVLTTLEDSRMAVLRAFDLLEETGVSSLNRNIIELGMATAVNRVNKNKEIK